VVARRAGQPRRLKRLDPAAAGLLHDTLAAHVSPGVELPASLLQALTNGLAPPTWNRYLQTLLPWRIYAEARGLPALPADPVTFACFLAEAGAGSIGYSQTKARVCAIRALSDLAGLASPHAHPLVVGYRRGALRAGRGAPRRGRATPIFGHEIPVPLPADSPPGRLEPARARGRGTLSGRSRRARDATARHMAFLHDGALRYDDTLEGQLGDILLFPDVVDLSVFGTKTDRRLAGQPAALPFFRRKPLARSARWPFPARLFGSPCPGRHRRPVAGPRGPTSGPGCHVHLARRHPPPGGRLIRGRAPGAPPPHLRTVAVRGHHGGLRPGHRAPILRIRPPLAGCPGGGGCRYGWRGGA
jgi:hypothetical protein